MVSWYKFSYNTVYRKELEYRFWFQTTENFRTQHFLKTLTSPRYFEVDLVVLLEHSITGIEIWSMLSSKIWAKESIKKYNSYYLVVVLRNCHLHQHLQYSWTLISLFPRTVSLSVFFACSELNPFSRFEAKCGL